MSDGSIRSYPSLSLPGSFVDTYEQSLKDRKHSSAPIDIPKPAEIEPALYLPLKGIPPHLDPFIGLEGFPVEWCWAKKV